MTDYLGQLRAALADRYAIEREIGAGGMATVYLAQDLKHNRRVAVKVLNPELAVAIGGGRGASPSCTPPRVTRTTRTAGWTTRTSTAG